jgi:hypothetical protein
MAMHGQWMIPPYVLVKEIPNLHISPISVVPQHERCPWTIVDYAYYLVNQETVHLSPKEAMQFGHTLFWVIHKIVEADPHHGPAT